MGIGSVSPTQELVVIGSENGRHLMLHLEAQPFNLRNKENDKNDRVLLIRKIYSQRKKKNRKSNVRTD